MKKAPVLFYFALTLMFTSSWLGFSLGFFYQINDTIRGILSLFFYIVLFFLLFLIVATSRFNDKVPLELKSGVLKTLIYMLSFCYLLFGIAATIFQVLYPGTSGEFRMFFFNQVNAIGWLSSIFVFTSVFVTPLIIILQAQNFGKISDFASFSWLIFNVGTNSRFGILLAFGLFLIRRVHRINGAILSLAIAGIIFVYYVLSYFRLNIIGLSILESVKVITGHNLDYLTISSGVYDFYSRDYDLGVWYAPFTFFDTIVSKLCGIKSVEGRISDISSNVLFFTDHNTGPFNAFFTSIALFSSSKDFLGILYGEISILLLAFFHLYIRDTTFKRYFAVSILLSGFMPFIFTLAWFVGILWCLLLKKQHKNQMYTW